VGGEFLVESAVYLLRSALRRIKERRTVSWRAVQATVHDTKATAGEVETIYTYQFDGGYYTGHDNRDFLWKDAAERFVTRFSVGTAVSVRVNPSRPEQMAFRDDDQGL
jgi:Protein of unknown function (DUF3592)